MELPSIGDPLRDSWWPYIVALIVGLVTCIRSYMGGNECPSKERVDGKTVVVTGAGGGMGLETAFELAKRGADVVLACRNLVEGEKVCAKIRAAAPNVKVDALELDLTSMKSVRSFAERLPCDRVDVLVNNAGVVFCPYEKTEDGFEKHLASNYLGHFLLTHLLLPRLKRAANARIICVSAQAHHDGDIKLTDLNRDAGYAAREAFAQSKLALILMARHMALRLKYSGVSINALHPGIVRGTRHMRLSPLANSYMIQVSMLPWMWMLMKTPLQGAQTSIYLAVSSDVQAVSGKYFGDCELKEPSARAKDDQLAEKLYKLSCSMLGLAEI